jgi:cyclophilin family peptidyl-prolyl cis-trans isomerase
MILRVVVSNVVLSNKVVNLAVIQNGAASNNTEYANMPTKTNRMRPFFVFLFATTSLVFLQIGQSNGQGTAPSSSKNDGPTAKKRLTPEERATEKQKKLELENQIAANRRGSFGMLPENDDSVLGKKYQAAFNRFRDAAVDLNQVQMTFHLSKDFSQPSKNKINQEWQVAIHDSFLAKANWLDAAAEVFLSDPDKYATIGDTLVEMMLADVELDRTDGWIQAAKAIVRSKKFSGEDVLRGAGLIAFANSEFDFMEECLEFQKKEEAEPKYLSDIDATRQKWLRELEIRAREAEKNDNPMVEFITTKGRLVMELYEDSAPETVKSFIYLTENGFFNRKSFFRVEKHLIAQTGCEKGDGTGDAGYTIPSEADLPNRRDHFRGSMAIALGSDPKTGQVQPSTGSSQFYFSFLPTTHLDGKYTVFGRVVEGVETLSFFRVMNLGEEAQRKEDKRPDVIHTSKVLRKRDTEYKPKITAGKLRK